MILSWAQNGYISGEPIHEIWFQSNERRLIPKPVTVPNNWFMTTSS